MTVGNPHYPHLFSALKIGRHTLKNRILFGSMHNRLETLDRSVEREALFFAERARGGAAMLITAATSPSQEGRMEDDSHLFSLPEHVAQHLPITKAAHDNGALMLLQVHHSGRYGKHPELVAPTAVRSPINPLVPREMTEADIERTLEDFVRTAGLAREANYDGVEIMGSEGYLINQFTCPRANQRSDGWGGTIGNRIRFPVEIVRRMRGSLGPDFLIFYRMSALDLVDGGLSGEETLVLAKAIEKAGADVLSTGVGWHESPVPTITYHVPRGAWAFAVKRLKQAVSIPVVATNRINTPEVAEEIIASGAADLVALARPLLADPAFAAKAEAGHPERINTCIACNQTCLDHLLANRAATCLVNPRGGRELDYLAPPPDRLERIAVVGSGPAGLSCAVEAARRGHSIDLFEADKEIGGQLNLAKRIPEKTEFNELIRYFAVQLAEAGVKVHLETRVTAAMLAEGGYDRVVAATGIAPRLPEIPGIDHSKVAGYLEILNGSREAGERVAIIGMGGIGYDVAEYLLGRPGHLDTGEFMAEWGVDSGVGSPGGLAAGRPAVPGRRITLLQRSTKRAGARLGQSTGWVLRAGLKKHGATELTGCTYLRIDDEGLHVEIDGKTSVIPADTVVICAGQEPADALIGELSALGIAADAIGGARYAGELDAARAIREGMELALTVGVSPRPS